MPEAMPPGRAGRLWLRGRVAFAERSLELLDRKQLLLRQELLRLATRSESARQEWAVTCAEADGWGLRVAALGGAAEVRLAAASVSGASNVEVPWRNTMGVVHPAVPRCELAVLPPVVAAAAHPAIGPAAAAYRLALESAATYAAADRSFAVLSAELHATERRRRAIEHRRLPRLRDALRGLELRLDELEREERVVTRRAGRHRAAQR